MIDFATEKAKKESSLNMNGQRMYIQTQDNRSRNYAQEYFDEGRHEKLKNR